MEAIFPGSKVAQTSNLKLNSNVMEILKRLGLVITNEVSLWQKQTKKRVQETEIKDGPKATSLRPSTIN